ncbi:MAG: hypothetical protein ACM3NH_04340 [Candidatus Saccharibacteria bacterium]
MKEKWPKYYRSLEEQLTVVNGRITRIRKTHYVVREDSPGKRVMWDASLEDWVQVPDPLMAEFSKAYHSWLVPVHEAARAIVNEHRRKGRPITYREACLKAFGREPQTGRGFGRLDSSTRREIASHGGKAGHLKGTAYEFTSEEARRAGRIGGQKSGDRRRKTADHAS